MPPDDSPTLAARLRRIPDSFDRACVNEIDRRLMRLAEDENVCIALAVESGSRAWGFPSPDSDYDCRFVYIRTLNDSLALIPKRDVIETPLTDLIDVNGWDLGKALRLLLKGNAVIVEWAMSPIVYDGDGLFRSELRNLCAAVADRDSVARHYFYLARRQVERHLVPGEPVVLKKFLYMLRPALVLRWLDCNPQADAPPMNMQALMSGAGLSAAEHSAIAELIKRKRAALETGSGGVPSDVTMLIRDQLERTEARLANVDKAARPERLERCDAFYRRWVMRCDQRLADR